MRGISNRSLLSATSAVMLLLGTASARPFTVKLDKQKVPRASETKFGMTYESDNYMRVFTKGSKVPLIMQATITDATVDIENTNDMQYSGPIYMGSSQSLGNVIYDTGSPWLTISTSGCTDCNSVVYNPASSLTSTQLDDTTQYLYYGSATLEGYFYEDTVCLSPDLQNCAYNSEFFGIFNQDGLSTDNGILGLCPQFTNDSSYVFALFNSGVITEKVIGYLILGENQQSEVMFGGYDLSLAAGALSWVPLIGTDWWQVALTSATYNGASFIVAGKSAIVDSGTSLIAMPFQDLYALADLFSNQVGALVCGTMCYYQNTCSYIQEMVGPVYFQFGTNQTFVATPDQYLMDGEEFGMSGTCYFGFQGMSGGKYIMGDVFLRNYYAVFDYENLQVGLAQNQYSTVTMSGNQLKVACLAMAGLVASLFY